jgi:diguanylate cyclase (GGDEF)-like protein
MAENTINNLSELIVLVDGLRAESADGSVGLLIGELQGLKRINSRFGYNAGDTAIDIFHQKLASVARDTDRAVRISGTMFALVIRDPMHEGHALLAAEKLSRLAEEWIVVADVRLRLDVHIGVSMLSSSADSAQQLLLQAEAALARGKRLAERFILWQPDVDGDDGTLTHPLFDAKRAIENGEFRVHYQPKVNLLTGATIGAEALVRWQSKDGLVSPANFLNEIERARATTPLLQFVLNSAAREMAGWTRKDPNFAVAINASSSDIENADLVEILSDVMGMWGLAPHNLVLEVTETTLMTDIDRGIESLRKLRGMGVRTSIDDFGTGYSSLAYLRELPVDEIKIDRSFIVRIAEDEADRRIVESLILLAHAMDLRVVAEGIEAQQVSAILAAMGCDIGQGYYFGYPIAAGEFAQQWFRANAERPLARV